MYIPKHFEVTQFEAIEDFVSRANVVDLVTVDGAGQPISSLLPCIWDTTSRTESDFGVLLMHMARQNSQWKSIQEGTLGLAIAHGSDAYISPSNYLAKVSNHRVVPTWNYQSVHLSGTLEVTDDVEELYRIVSSLTDFHESKRNDPWSTDQADLKYLEGQLKAIVGVTMRVKHVEAKDKLSQNRPMEDQQNIIVDLSKSERASAREVAIEMQKRIRR